MLARLFFGMNVESSYFKETKSARFEKLKIVDLNSGKHLPEAFNADEIDIDIETMMSP